VGETAKVDCEVASFKVEDQHQHGQDSEGFQDIQVAKATGCKKNISQLKDE